VSTRKQFAETDLYPPLRDYLVEHGYTVRSEVHDCDVVAAKDDELIVVELKRHLSVALLIQATDRQRVTESVYIAVPRPKPGQWRRQWRGTRRLLRRLELGLIFVAWTKRKARVEIVQHPAPYDHRRRPARRRAILEEVAQRSGDYNQGGSTRRELVTAYRENAIQIACYLDERGPQTPKALRALGTGPKTLSVLYSNFYGWFDRVGHGLYQINASGRAALKTYADVAAPYRDELAKQIPA
jgi:hypothetical protein